MASSQPPQQKEEEEGEVQSQPNPTAAQKRHDIQGLRTVAILAVFFFHMWPQQFPNGYLGVDVFFVISGYLIGMILLSRGDRPNAPQRVNEGGHVYVQLPTQPDEEGDREKKEKEADCASIESQPPPSNSIMSTIVWPITAALHLTVHFYRRRVQRIMPAYALTILGTLLVGRVMLIPGVDLATLKWDATWALALAYNMEGLVGYSGDSGTDEGDDYFEEVKSPRFLTHTWSLGVELQFYAVAPLLLGMCRWDCFRRLKYPYLLSIVAASCYARWLAPAAVAFGAMPCRLWQFFAGVLSYSLGSALTSKAPSQEELPQHSDDSEQIEPSRWRQVGGAVADYAMLGGLMALLGSPLHHPRLAFAGQAAVVLLTALLLHRHAHIRALTNRASVELGDLSYLVYLVHWPLLQFLRYRYGAWNVAGVLVGTSILFICVGAAYVLDRVLDSPLRRVANFVWLSLYLLALYAGCLAVILPLPQIVSVWRTNVLPLNGQLIPVEDYGPLFLELMDNGTLDVGKMSLEEKAMINIMSARTRSANQKKYMIDYRVTPEELQQIRKANGSDWPYKISFEGEGHLSMILVGNSHAAQIVSELLSVLRPLYSVFYAFILPGCASLDVRYRNGARKDLCDRYSQTIMALLKRLRPDVTIINYLWNRDKIRGNLSDDLNMRRIHIMLEETLQYSRLAILGLPSVVFSNKNSGAMLSEEIARRVWFQLPLDDLDLRLKAHLHYTSENRERVEYATRTIADCAYDGAGTSGGKSGVIGGHQQQQSTRCLFVDWAETFCDEREQKCRAYDAKTQLAHFVDTNHYSWLGSHRLRPLLEGLRDVVAATLVD